MIKSLKILTLITVATLLSCGGKEKREEASYNKKTPEKTENKVAASQRVDLSDKGIGPITSVELDLVVNEEMAAHGKEVYEKMCTACHKVEKKFIGPSPKGVLERRSPEWVMNMILNPSEMAQKNQLAKDLLMEFNGSPMANQNLTKEDARAVLEYFRTLK
tara:strand:- start:5952 stop:6434 length:483 start_codon:yes stop_codon:yes gene_type:complete